MIFLSILLVLALVQWWGSGAPLQKDGAFYRYLDWLDRQRVNRRPKAHLLMAVVLPTLVLWLLNAWVVSQVSSILGFLIAVPVLLYSLGRGDFSAQVGAYLNASERGDSVAAAEHLAQLQETVAEEGDPEDWPELHRQALRAVAYRGFERMFAVIFWFVILGPAGALLYRLSVLYGQAKPSRAATRWLWLLEWPAVRLMGLTWAMAGDFERCFFRCQRDLLNREQTSSALLYDQMLGALGSQDAQPGAANVDLDMIRASQPLFSRSLLLWVCVLALITLLA